MKAMKTRLIWMKIAKRKIEKTQKVDNFIRFLMKSRMETIIKETLGNVTILKCEREKPTKSCPQCNRKREFLAILPCHHQLCTTCLDFHYDSVCKCPTAHCGATITDVKYE